MIPAARSVDGALRERAAELGFALIGVAEARPSDHGSHYAGWLARDLHGEMGYLARPDALLRRLDVDRTLPGARSVVVVADAYYAEDRPGMPGDASRGVIARYARGADYHRVLRRKLSRLLEWVRAEAGVPVEGRVYVDTGPLLERELARRAGLGWFGRNTMLIHPRKGSYFFLGALLLDLPLPADAPFAEDRCGSCHACLDACPTGALLGRNEVGAPVMDARRCISYLTIEQRGPIPRELRPLIGNRIYGCDICQEVCPFNIKFARPSSEPRYGARGPGEPPDGVEPDPTVPAGWHPGTRSPALVDLLRTALDEGSWESFSRGSPMRRAGRAGFARNVCVALGNWGDPSAVSVLSQALKDPHPLVRAHAAWALGRIASDEAVRTLRDGLLEEEESSVRDEVERALEASSRS